MPKYLALTLGPVVKTLLQARKTRELWACSYLLSSLMERIVAALDPSGKHILIPHIPDDILNKPRFGAGIFPDGLFMEADPFFERPEVAQLPEAEQASAVDNYVATQVEAAMRSLAKATLLPQEVAKELTEATNFWQQFFRVRWTIQGLADIRQGQLSLALSPFLNALELEDVGFPEEPPVSYLNKLFVADRFFKCEFVEPLRIGKGRYETVMGENSVFPSTSDLAAFELYQQFSTEMKGLKWNRKADKHEEFYRAIEAEDSLRPHFQPYHKYFCIVQADGDGIGAAIQQLDKESDYTDFSEKLAAYGVTAAEKIDAYGGKPVYIGGDDLLFLCPVRSDQGNVFDLIADLDEAFQAQMQVSVPVSLSYGINIVYYKYPLFEAIAASYDLLGYAKKHKNAAGEKKNSLCFQFTKHSGSAFRATFSKSYLAALNLAMTNITKAPGPRQGDMVSSLVFKLKTLEKLFLDLIRHIANDEERLSERLDTTLLHYFAEWKDNPWFKVQRVAIHKLLLAAITELGTPAAKDEEPHALGLFYATMRLLQFITITPKNNHIYDKEDIAQAAG